MQCVIIKGKVEVKMNSKRSDLKFDAPAELWTVETKVNAVAQMLQAYNVDIQADEMDFYGLGMIVRDLAIEIQKIRNYIEKTQPDFGVSGGTKSKRRKRNGDV